MFLSIIIPLYNCEKYILRQLKSVLRLPISKSEYEIILVDDGSSDNSVKVAEKFLSVEEATYLIVSQVNNGPSTARNRGKELAKGKWIWFIDADDEIIANNLLHTIEVLRNDEDIDMVEFSYCMEFSENSKNDIVIHRKQFVTGVEYLENHRGGMYLWNKIIRSDIIAREHFIEGIYHIEDMCFLLHCIVHMKRIATVSENGYVYHKDNVMSISKAGNDRPLANKDTLIVYEDLLQFRNSLSGLQQTVISQKLNYCIAGHLFTIWTFDDDETMDFFIKKYSSLNLYPVSVTGNFKVDLFIVFANTAWCVKGFLKMRHLCRTLYENVKRYWRCMDGRK